MRVGFEVADEVMAAAMKATGYKTKRATVEECLRRFIEMKAQEALHR